MYYKRTLQQLVSTAFDLTGDLKEMVDYVQFTQGDYDIATATPAYTFDYQTGVPAIFTRFTEKEMDDMIMATKDMKVLIPALKFTLTLDQATEDTMVDSTGKTWNVCRYLGVTGGSLHIFQVREA